MSSHGLRLQLCTAGRPGGPPLALLHGISFAAAVWRRQLGGALAARFRLLAPDLRGHGASDKPADAALYQDGELWADDLRALLGEAPRPVIVAWSYGGILALDYLRRFDPKALSEAASGLVLVGALTRNGSRAAFDDLGAGAAHLQGMLRSDFDTQYAASQAFVAAMTRAPLEPAERERLLAMAMMTPPYVRHALAARRVEHDETLRGLELPTLIIHGAEDQIVRPAAAERVAGLLPGARLELWEGVGHAPFLEAPERFGAALAAFAAPLHPSPTP